MSEDSEGSVGAGRIHILVLVPTWLTLLTLVGGSFSVIRECAGPSANGESCGIAAGLGWAVVVLVVGLVGSFALLAARRADGIASWLGVCLLAAIGLWGPGLYLGTVVPESVLSVGLLLVIDASVIYVGWRLILRSRSRISSR